ncbi:MAG: nucleotidyltransferase family protein [Dehalococcoidia bacterium]|nr:nucleotidyltransferase family protein [Dehalococcoidia bacterium]
MSADIEQAVLLAAGRGTRLGGLTHDIPKPLLEVGGRPIIFRILEGLAGAGVRDVTVITGHLADVLEGALGDGGRWGLAVRCVRQERLDGTATATALARPFLRDSPFFVGWGDIVVDAANYARVIEGAGTTGAAIAVNEVDDPWAGAAAYVDATMRVLRVVEKPPKGMSTTRWNNAGLAVLPPAIWAEVDRLEPSMRGEYELPRAIAALVDSGHAVVAVPVEGPWFDIGTPENLEGARRYFGS